MTTTHFLHITRRMLAAIGGGAILALAAAPALAAPGGGGTPISCNSISPYQWYGGRTGYLHREYLGRQGRQVLCLDLLRAGSADGLHSCYALGDLQRRRHLRGQRACHRQERRVHRQRQHNDSGRDQQSAGGQQRQL